MNVLIINTSERTGGAAVAAGRLMHALQKANVDVQMLVRDKQTANPAVYPAGTSWIDRKLNYLRFVWERLIIFMANKGSRKNLFQISIANTGMNISRHPLVCEADIIHLHWINQGFLSLVDIKELIGLGKPIVWTLHDLWPATAICHYPDRCRMYQEACSFCPLQVPSPLFDLAASVFKQKKKMNLGQVHFVGCSRWIASMAQQSALLEKAAFVSIPNPIDVSVFSPVGKKAARSNLQLPADKYLFLFAAAKLSDTRKGAAYLVEACKRLKQQYQEKIEIVLMGNGSEEFCEALPFKVNSLGYISDPTIMAAAYSCADLFIIPSLEDNLPNTIMESMACGTPCVGFHIGGIPEMIDHQVNGYVAEYKNSDDLAVGIQWVLTNKDTAALSDACVKKVQENYTEQVVAEKYITLYEQLLKHN